MSADQIREIRWGNTKCLSLHVLVSVSGLIELIGISELPNGVIQSVNNQTGPSLLALSWLIHLELLDPEKVTWLPRREKQNKNTSPHHSRRFNLRVSLSTRMIWWEQNNVPASSDQFHCFTCFNYCVETPWNKADQIKITAWSKKDLKNNLIYATNKRY